MEKIDYPLEELQKEKPIRRRSLKKVPEDLNAFRHSRDRHLGVSVSSEFYQPCPQFFTRERSQLNVVGLYRGASIFLLCNGPSMAELDLSLLCQAGVMTYGMNNGPKTFRPDYWSCVDDPARFIKSIWLDPRINKIVPMSFFEKKIFDNEKWEMMDVRVGDCPNVWGFCRNEKFMPNRFLFEDTMNWGNHKDYGGGRSIMLPVFRIMFLLGFRKVYLLGCDFDMSETNTYHFDEQRTKGAVNCNLSTYKRMKEEYFPSLKPYFDALGYQIYNCNPKSKLEVFPYISYEDAIKEATSKLGDVSQERTWGMYSVPKDKRNWKNEPPDTSKKHLKKNKQAAEQPKIVEQLAPEKSQEKVDDGATQIILNELQRMKAEMEAMKRDSEVYREIHKPQQAIRRHPVEVSGGLEAQDDAEIVQRVKRPRVIKPNVRKISPPQEDVAKVERIQAQESPQEGPQEYSQEDIPVVEDIAPNADDIRRMKLDKDVANFIYETHSRS